MKNIHILPTLQPSRLWFHKLNRNLGFSDLPMEYNGSGTWVEGRNIYITNDEEIKEGDWFMSDFNSFPIHNIKELSEREGTLGWEQKDLKNNLKIILTDNKDLIKDGVQAIDDEFLEWFVKNPTCEFVEVNKLCYGALSGFAEAGYKIILPKEEQDKEMYSEEEVIELLTKRDSHHRNTHTLGGWKSPKEWFEQFKKK